MKRLGISLGSVGLLVLTGVGCSDDPAVNNPGSAGSAANAGTGGTPGGSGGGSSGMTGAGTAGMSTGGGGAGLGGGGSGGAGFAGGGAGGTAGSGGQGGMGGGAACDSSTGKALQFKGGVNDIVAGDLGDDLAGGNAPRTIELWAHFTSGKSWSGEGSVIEMGRKVGQANQVFGLDMADAPDGRTDATTGKFDPYTNGIGDNDPTPVMIPIEGWAHLAFGYDGAGHFQFVVNGAKVTLPHPGDGSGSLATTKGIFTLGASQSFGTEGWDGVMDEVRVWKVFRTEADIKRDMKVKLKGTETDLVAYWNLDEGTGETADDVKKTANHQLKFCTANGGACPVQNAAKPTWVASDIPGPFTCAP